MRIHKTSQQEIKHTPTKYQNTYTSNILRNNVSSVQNIDMVLEKLELNGIYIHFQSAPTYGQRRFLSKPFPR